MRAYYIYYILANQIGVNDQCNQTQGTYSDMKMQDQREAKKNIYFKSIVQFKDAIDQSSLELFLTNYRKA